MRTRYLDFKLTNGEFKKQRPYLAIDLDAVKNGDSKNVQILMKWTPYSYKTETRVRLTNKRTKDSISWKVIEVKHLARWLIVLWDPEEVINAVMRLLPMAIGTGVIVSAVAQTAKQVRDNNEEDH